MKILVLLLLFSTQVNASDTVNVWKSPTCGCCNDWIKYLKKNNFKVIEHNTGNYKIRKELGIDKKLSSCHTAIINEYVIEGHVPVKDIRRLLIEKPKNIIGLSVPGMPIGSPGMDNKLYGEKEPFDVLIIEKDGLSSQIYSNN